jgi:hypothetical protein
VATHPSSLLALSFIFRYSVSVCSNDSTASMGRTSNKEGVTSSGCPKNHNKQVCKDFTDGALNTFMLICLACQECIPS